MSLQFLNPNWLWALSLIAIPIIVHLFNFRRYKTVYFTNVHLLKNIKKDTQSKNRLKELLILFSRILLITFLVIAFAQPIWVNKEKQKQYNDQADLIIIVDNSFSMSFENTNGVRLEVAKQNVLDIISAYPSNTKIMLLSTDLLAKQLCFKTKDDIYTSLSNIKVSAYTQSINDVVEIATSRFKQNSNSKHVYIISDFQKSDYSPIKSTDKRLKYFLVPIKTIEQKNISIDTCYFYSPIHNLNEDEALIYSLTNTSENDLVDYGVKLVINNSLKTISTVDIPSGKTVLDTFYYKNSSAGLQKGKIVISDFPVVYDNDLYFTYTIKQKVQITILSDDIKNVYLDAFFKNNNYFQVQTFKVKDVSSDYLKQSEVLIVDVNTEMSTGLQEQILDYVQQGKKIIIFANSVEKNKTLWTGLSVSFSEQDTTSIQLSKFNNSSNLYKNAFSKTQEVIDLPFVKNAMGIHRSDEWLLKTKNNNIVVAQNNLNNKSVLLFSVPLTNENRALYTHPVFIPLLYNFIIKSQALPLYFYSNQPNTYHLQTSLKFNDDVLHISDHKNSWIPEQYRTDLGIKIHLPVKLESGYYSINYKEKSLQSFACNYSRDESILDYYSIQDLKDKNTSELRVFDNKKLSGNYIKDQISSTKNLWYYAIILTLIFAFAEILLILFWRN